MRSFPAIWLSLLVVGCTCHTVKSLSAPGKDLCSPDGGRVQFAKGDLDRSYCLRDRVPIREVVSTQKWATQGVCLNQSDPILVPLKVANNPVCDKKLQTLKPNDTLRIGADFNVSLTHEKSTDAYATGIAAFGPFGATKDRAAWLTFTSKETNSTYYVYFADVPPHGNLIDKWYVVEEYAAAESEDCKKLAPTDDGAGSKNVAIWPDGGVCGDFTPSTASDSITQEMLFRKAVHQEAHKQTGVGDGHEKP